MESRTLARRIDLWLLLALSLGLAAAVPLFTSPGLLNTRGGGDSPFLLFRLYELTGSLQAGIFPVRWMPDAAYGYGFPFFNFYAALPFYFAAGLRLAGFGFVAALKAVQALGFLVAAAGMYAWARRGLGSRPAACVAAVAYTYAPFHLVNVYVRGDSLSEFYAFAWYPWILMALERVIEHATPRRVAALALAYGALLMTHNVSMLIFTPLVALYALAQLVAARASWRRWLAALAGGLLGVALAAWVWLPALAEGQYVQLGVQTTGYFSYAEHFRSLAPANPAQGLVQPDLAFNYLTTAGPTPFAMGLAQAILVALGALALLWRAVRGRHLPSVLALAGLLIATFMITPWSQALYERIPLLAFVQFPWRFLSVQSVFAAVAVGAILAVSAERDTHRRAPAGEEPAPVPAKLLSAAGALALTVLLIVPQVAALPLDFLLVGDADVTAERLQLYELFTGNIGTTIRAEYLPQWVVPRPWTGGQLVYGEPDPAKVLAGEAAATRAWARADAQGWRVEAGAAGATLAFPTYYFPGWAARIDGAPAGVRPLEGPGWIALDVPAGAHDITLAFERTPLRAGAEAAAGLAAVAVMALLVWGRGGPLWTLGSRGDATSGRPHGAAPTRPSAGVDIPLAAFALLTLLATALLQPSLTATTDGDLTWDFAAAPYLTHGPLRLGDTLRLREYAYSADTLRAGGVLTVTADWEGSVEPGLHALIDLVPAGCQLPRMGLGDCPSYAFPRNPAFVAQPPAGRQSYAYQLLDFIPPGVYLPRVRVALDDDPSIGLPARTASGLSRGEIYLRPVRVERGGTPAVEPGPTPSGLSVDPTFGFAHLGDNRLALDLTLWWQPRAAMAANYGLSLRLHDLNGAEWGARDLQAGAEGFYPSGLWRPGEGFFDNLLLPVTEGIPNAPYTLTVTLYDVRTLAPVEPPARVRVDWWPAPLPRPIPPLAARFGGLGLQRLEAPESIETGAPLAVAAHWSVVESPLPALTARWSLVDAQGEDVYTLDTTLAPGSDATTWPQYAYVLGRHTLAPPADLAPGAYTLRLAVLDAGGRPLGTYDRPLVISGHPREFTVPPLGVTLNADYGGVIRLHGYTLERQGDVVRLTLAWGALEAPGHDYKVFVHVFDPATEAIPTQHDSAPREGQYPTSRWLKGEVVTDTITLDLSAVPPGTYRIGVGLYDATGRLGERVVLPDGLNR